MIYKEPGGNTSLSGQGHCRIQGAVVLKAVPGLCLIATMWVSCLHWWIINRGYWSPWQNDSSEPNLIYGSAKKKKRDSRSGRLYKCHRQWGSATFKKLKHLHGHSSQADLFLSSKIRIELGIFTRTLRRVTFEETPEGDSKGPFLADLPRTDPACALGAVLSAWGAPSFPSPCLASWLTSCYFSLEEKW